MASCPVCSQQLNASFGMVQCSQCQTVLFIDFTGNIVMGDQEESASPLESQQESIPAYQHDVIEVSSVETPFDGEIPFPPPFEEEVPQDQPPPFDESGEREEIINSVEPTEAGPDIYQEVAFETNLESGFEIEPQAPFDATPRDSVNQIEEPESRSVGLGEKQVYRVIIDEIDTAQLRASVLDAIRDSRLGLVNDEVQPTIKSGTMVIQGLNPVKASYIINSLKELPLPIKWEVYGEENR